MSVACGRSSPPETPSWQPVLHGCRPPAGCRGCPVPTGKTRWGCGYSPFRCIQTQSIRSIGWFNEELLTNEDYEFNTRIRQDGGVVWLDPSIRTVYLARPDLGALARQYFRYGYWKLKMLRRYPGTLRWRQALPPLFVGKSDHFWHHLSIFIPPGLYLLGIELVLYLAHPACFWCNYCTETPSNWLYNRFPCSHCHHAHLLGCRLFMES